MVIVIIAAVASSLSIVASQYSIQTSNEIRKIASETIAASAQNEAYDLSRIVVNKIDSVTTNLQVLANGPSIQAGRSQDIVQLFDAAQYSTEDLTEYYMWLDSEGKIVSASNIARASYQYNSMWSSEKPSFLLEPQKTGGIYYSNIIKSPNDNVDRLYIAYPIFYSLHEDANALGDFRGVIVAAMRLDTLGTILTSELSPTFESDVSLADTDGEMVYSVDRSVIGKNLFENPIYLTTPIITELDEKSGSLVTDFLQRSNSMRQAEITNINIRGKMITIASYPIIQTGNHFWTLYITAPHALTDNTDQLLANQDTFIMLTMFVIGSVSVGLTYLILTWNNRLERTVKVRTAQLDRSNESLSQSNAQLENANEQLKVHASLQREFVNIAAHELRTPIMPILGITDLLESNFNYSEKEEIVIRKSDFEILSRNSRRLERLATDILDVSRIETRSLRLDIETFDLLELIEHTVNDIKNLFSNDKITYQIDVKETIMITADKSKIGQVLSNLLNNAAKFTDRGLITITAQEENDGSNGNERVVLAVTDSGIGIDPEIMPRLFTKFSNMAGLDRSQVGSGLGLYISKGIIEAHGGKIWAENNKHGKGSTFYFMMPTSVRSSVSLNQR
jgi:signal transduction histidine kinase